MKKRLNQIIGMLLLALTLAGTVYTFSQIQEVPQMHATEQTAPAHGQGIAAHP
ncbi:MAG: hypothetical protein AAF399_06575 [Bacteroidota bacterium]